MTTSQSIVKASFKYKDYPIFVANMNTFRISKFNEDNCLFFNYSTQTPPVTYGPNPDNIPSPCLKQETAMEIWVIENTQELIWVYEQIMNKLLSISDSQLEYIPKYKIPDYIV